MLSRNKNVPGSRILAALFLAVSVFIVPPAPAQDAAENGLIMLELETGPNGELVVPEDGVEAGPVQTKAPDQKQLADPEGETQQMSTQQTSTQQTSTRLPTPEEFMAQEKKKERIEKADSSVQGAPALQAEQQAPQAEKDVKGISVEEPDENLFFDAEALVPTGEMVPGAPRKVNPALEPGSKFVVVRKNRAANSYEAGLIAAERAIKLGRYESALEMYERLYERNKRDPNALMGRAVAAQHLGRTDEAIQAYAELLELRPQSVEAEINMLGLMGQNYPSVALRRLSEVRKKHPDHPGLAAQTAVLQAGMGRYNEALQYLGMAAALEPKNANHLFNMAVIADRAGMRKQAIQYYERALEVDTVYGGGRSVPRESIFERLAQLR